MSEYRSRGGGGDGSYRGHRDAPYRRNEREPEGEQGRRIQQGRDQRSPRQDYRRQQSPPRNERFGQNRDSSTNERIDRRRTQQSTNNFRPRVHQEEKIEERDTSFDYLVPRSQRYWGHDDRDDIPQRGYFNHNQGTQIQQAYQ